MDFGPTSDATLLERALGGEPVADAEIRALVAVVESVRAVDRTGLAPHAEFVTSLRDRLLDEHSEIAVGRLERRGAGGAAAPDGADGTVGADSKDADGDTSGGPSGDGPRATVVRLPHRPLQLVAAVAASFVLVAALLGIASRSAVPGDLLYPVKQLLDRAAVGLSGSRLDEGRTHLAQAQQHISEARDLLDRGDVDPANLDVALDAATASVTTADAILTDVYTQEGRPEALTELADFLTRARLQVDAMDPRIPQASRAAYDRLREVLGEAEVQALGRLAACTTCGDAAVRAQAALEALVAEAARTPGTEPELTLPPATIAVPSVAVTTDGVEVDGGGVTLPGATIDLPSAGITTTGVVVGGGGVTLPGATVPLPTLSVSVTTPLVTSTPTLPGASLMTAPLLAPDADEPPLP